MVNLKDVTLVYCFTVAHKLSNMAIRDCTNRVQFGDVKIFTDIPEEIDAGNIQHVIKIQKFANIKEMEQLVVYNLPKAIKTSHVLFAQWDSWVTNPDKWTDEFLKYDYIGAPWWYQDKYNVGNGGFNLRSKALLDFLASHKNEFPTVQPEDHVLCREYQHRLPQFKWAPQELAWRFSFERTFMCPPNEVFGFHGIFNWSRVLTTAALEERATLAGLDPYIRSRVEYPELLAQLDK